MTVARWYDLYLRPILIVSGKGGTGKSTVAAAVAAAAAASGRRVLLAEVEGRGEVAHTLGVADPGFAERSTAAGFRVLSITPQAAALEYLHLFFGLDRVSRTIVRSGALDQVFGAAPGFRDLLACGKLYEITEVRRTNPRDRGRPRYDLVVVDGPPTGQIAAFLGAPAAFGELIQVGRMRRQALAIRRLLRDRAHLVLVTVLEEMAVAETLESLPAIVQTGVPVAAIVANRRQPPVAPRGAKDAFARLTPAAVAEGALAAGVNLAEEGARDLLTAALAAESRHRLQAHFRPALTRSGLPVADLPDLPGFEPPHLVEALAATIRGHVPGSPPTASAQAPPAAVPAPGGMGPRLDGTRIVVVCGSGGVGKTTISAAIAVHVARAGRRTILLTVDPARRLATALRLPARAGDRTRIRLGGGARLEALQLDTRRTFDALVERYAGSAAVRDRILGNAFYQRIATTLAGTGEYMAMEKLYELATEEDHDVIVIDTPPTRSALSFLDAPRRLTDFLGGRFLRWMLWPSRRAGRLGLGVARFGAAAFARTAGRIVGVQTLTDTVEFLSAFEGMVGGFKERAARVVELLGSEDCAFVVVTAPTRVSVDETGYFVDRLSQGGMRLAAVVANRWHGGATGVPGSSEASLHTAGTAAGRAVAAVLAEGARGGPQRAAEARAMSAFLEHHPEVPVVAVPELPGDVHDVAGLRRVATELFG